MLDPRYSSLLYSSPQNYPQTREFQMIDCRRNSRSVKNQVFELDIYIYARSSPGGHEEVRATKHQFVSTGSIRFHPLERALRDSPTIAPTCIHRRMTKGRFGGAKGLASRNKIALRHRGTRVFDHHPRLFTKSSLNSHSEGFHCETILAQRRASN